MLKKSRTIWMLIILMTAQIFTNAAFANPIFPELGPEPFNYQEVTSNEEVPGQTNSINKNYISYNQKMQLLRTTAYLFTFLGTQIGNTPGNELMELNMIKLHLKGRKCQPNELIIQKEEHIFNNQHLPPERAPKIYQKKGGEGKYRI